MRYFLALLPFLATIGPALAAEERVIRFDDPATYFPAALGKQVDVRFSPGFTAAHLPGPDLNRLILSELPEGKACFFGADQGLDPDDPKLAGLARPEQGDVCVPRAEVSARYDVIEASGAPPSPFYATDKLACAWHWILGKGIGVWAESCKFETGSWEVQYDPQNDYFTLSVDGSSAYPVLRQFRKKPEEGPEVLLPELRKAGLIPDDDLCQFAPAESQAGPKGWSLWEIVPVGSRKEEFEQLPDDEVPEPPCGEIGYAVDYVGFFMVSESRKDRVLFVNLGQDGTMFDAFSIALF